MHFGILLFVQNSLQCFIAFSVAVLQNVIAVGLYCCFAFMHAIAT